MPNISLRSAVNQRKFKINSITFRKEEPWKKHQDRSRNKWVNSNWYHRNYMGNYGKDMYEDLDMPDSGAYYQGPGMFENPNPGNPGYNYGGY